MKVEKRNLNEALRVLGKVVCQTSPLELYRSVRFIGNGDGVMTKISIRFFNDREVRAVWDEASFQ